MDERRALMSAIIAEPDEDTPRLVFADWLQEHGDEHDRARAEFIRAQVEAAKLPRGAARTKLERRAAKLEKSHRAAWLAPLVAINQSLAPDSRPFARGLLMFISATPTNFLKKAWQKALPDALAQVGVKGLLIYDPTRRVADLAASEAFRWLADMTYYGANDELLNRIGQSPNFAHLSELELSDSRVTDAGLRSFARDTGMARLRDFTIDCWPEGRRKKGITSAGVLALLGSARLPLLSALAVEGPEAGEFDYPAFFADPGLKRLTKLRLGMHVALSAVVACPHLANLRELHLESTDAIDADVSALLDSPTFARLKELTLTVHRPLSRPSAKKLRARFRDGLALDTADEG